MIQVSMKQTLLIKYLFFIFGLSFLTIQSVFAQGMTGATMMSCPMCNNMGWGGMALGVLVMIGMIAAFIALVLFLIRRSRSSP